MRTSFQTTCLIACQVKMANICVYVVQVYRQRGSLAGLAVWLIQLARVSDQKMLIN